MGFFDTLFAPKPYSAQHAKEVLNLVDELIKIGIKEDYLSESPGYGYNAQCRHIRTRQIGQRLDEIGGNVLMQWAYRKVQKKAGQVPASHLEYAWRDVGQFEP